MRASSRWLVLMAACLAAAPSLALDLTMPEVFANEDEQGGFRAGPLDLRGAAAISFGYDSNVDAIADPVVGENVGVGQLLLRADNRSERNDFNAQAFVAAYRYSESNQYDTTEYGATTDFATLLSPHDTFEFSLDGQRRFERRIEIETPTSIPVSLYDDLRANLRQSHAFNRLSTRLSFDGQRLQYADASQQFRDHTLTGGELRLAYAFKSSLSWFASAYFKRDEFDSPSPWVASADTTGALLGVLVANDIVDLELGAGYFERRFADGSGTLDGLALRGAMSWRPTRLTTLRAEISRSDEPTQVPGAFGKIRNELLLRVIHDYSRRLSLIAGTRLVLDEFETIESDDKLYLAELGANWQVGKHSMLSFTYDYGSRDTQSARGFLRHIASLSFIGRL
jgi:hypothetical protein